MGDPEGAVDPISRHKCLVYDGDVAEQLPVVVPLFVDGLRDNWRCLYLGSPHAVTMFGGALDRNGIDVERETDRGSLVLSSDRGHLIDGTFEPTAMIDGLRETVEVAVRDGYVGLCASGDMRWELGEDRNFDRLVEYEARLEQMFRDLPLRGICQYHRDLVPAAAVRDALVTHRAAYVGSELNRDNLFYLPPELLLDGGDDTSRTGRGEWMYQQIVRVLDAERARDRALDVLRASEAEQRRLAQQLAELNRELEQRVVARTAELDAANRSLEAFSYSVAHDLRAPLRAIRSFTKMLDEDAGDALAAGPRDHLDRVLAATDRMDERIEALLDLSRISRAELTRTPVDLSTIAASLADELRAREPSRAVAVAVDPRLDARADPRLVRALLENLMSNAWKFTAPRDRAMIDVGARRDGASCVFFVRDNGVGFDAARAERLFTPFQRMHGREFPGTGIGLATAQRIVERHRGRIWIDSTVGAGTTVHFTLPD